MFSNLWSGLEKLINAFSNFLIIFGTCIKVSVKCSEKNELKITPGELKKAIGKKTKCLIINSPSNPTGSS